MVLGHYWQVLVSIVGTGQYLVVLGHCLFGTGQYLVVLGHYWVVLVTTRWYWFKIWGYWSVLGGAGSILGGTG